MKAWRDHLRQGRRVIHQTMGVPAILLLARGGTPHPVTIRGPHTKRPLSIGDLAGGGEGWAERESTQPRILLWRAELPFAPRNGCIISVEAGEAYRVETVEAPQDQTIYVNVVQLTLAETAGLPVPANSSVPSAPAGEHPGLYRPGFTHTQPTAAAAWVVNHGLGYKPAVAVILADGTEVEASVVHATNNQLVVTFDQSETGEVRCV